MTSPSLVLLLVIAGLFASGLYLVLQRSLMRMVLGFVLLGHAANLALVSTGGPPGAGPADPLPRAMALTAIVITFGVTALLLGLVFRAVRLTGDDQVSEPAASDEDDEDSGAEETEPDR